ncbi:peptigoglycan-binding protein LysM [Photobacterium aquae]|uniref:Peptigoglycan-binding protein LysM n=1 Tax=Photobacterium aquae TaxID=1195763 RepID=A0A0J1HBW5_9GAMM|nr:murein DD-endopeptidase MepM [Photobacterium aquae]KLV09164.1 peptigoglycan-binding protein LysM [Photobacterium aquae]
MNKVKGAVAALRELPRQHRFALGSISFFLLAVFLWQPEPDSSGQVVGEPLRKTVAIPLTDLDILSEQNSEPLGAAIDPQDPDFQAPKDELDQQLAENVTVAHSHQVAAGENLSAIFQQYGLPLADMYQLVAADRSIQNLGVGQTLTWTLDDSGRVAELQIKRSAKIRDEYKLGASGYQYRQHEETGVLKPVMLTGRVSGSFYNSALAAGLTPSQIQTLVQALQWRFDFGRDARKGDRFAVAVEREFIDGKAVSRGTVKALHYLSGSRDVFVMRYSDGQFYDENGQSLNRALRRIPLDKRYRISSSFNPHRKHPITGRISPHNGTDFATPIGTPVLAAGDGVVVKARKHPLAGNYIVIKHGREYTTRYLHLHRLLVKVGDRVEMGQRIALSGNTGRSTGPHLHYELIKKNRPVNAMKVPLPQAAPIPSSQRGAFKQQAQKEKAALADVMPG